MNKFLTLILTVLFTTHLVAQETDRTKPPKAGPLPKVSFPHYEEHVLPNGLKVFIVENHEQPLVAINVISRGGSVQDGQLPGLASFSAELLTKGTGKRSAAKIAEEIDFIGASLSATSSWDATTISVSSLSKRLSVALDVLADVVLNPTFPQEEVDRLRAQRLATIKQQKAVAGYLVATRQAATLFPGHPYGNPSDGTEESIGKITRETCKKFHDETLLPNSSFIVIAGDVEPKQLLKAIAKYFGSWKKSSGKYSLFPLVPDITTTRVIVVDKPGAVQSAISMTQLGIARQNPDYIPYSVLNTLFGGFFNSRINKNLREVHGYTYGARSSLDQRMLPGAFAITAEVRNDVTDSSITEMYKEFRRITSEPISAEELQSIKNYVTGSFPLRFETPAQVASALATLELYGLPKNYYDTYNEKVNAVTSSELLGMAKSYWHPDAVAIIVAGNAGQIAKKLEKFGTVEIYDADGKIITKK